MQKLCGLLVAALLSAGCASKPPQQGTDLAGSDERRLTQGLAQIIRAHGDADVVADEHGVGLATRPARLQPTFFDGHPTRNGYLVELQINVWPGDGGLSFFERVTNIGPDRIQACDAALENFVASAFHPIYKGLMNRADSHQAVEQWRIGGVDRQVAAGDIVGLGGTRVDLPYPELRSGIRKVVEGLNLDSTRHWVKVVYGQSEGKCVEAEVLVDDHRDEVSVEQLRRLPWPHTKDVYMAKECILIL